MGLKLKATYETEVYICKDGYIAIKQIDAQGNDDAIVVLSADQAEQVYLELQHLVEHKHDWWSVEDEDEDEPATPTKPVEPSAAETSAKPAPAKSNGGGTLPLLQNA